MILALTRRSILSFVWLSRGSIGYDCFIQGASMSRWDYTREFTWEFTVYKKGGKANCYDTHYLRQEHWITSYIK
jgi:hypothetical protein